MHDMQTIGAATEYWRRKRPPSRTHLGTSLDREVYEAIKAIAAVRRLSISRTLAALVAERVTELAHVEIDRIQTDRSATRPPPCSPSKSPNSSRSPS